MLTIAHGNFTMTVREDSDDDAFPGYSYTPSRAVADYAPAGRAKALKAAEYLGPWCPNCGKRGTTCKGRTLEGCKARAFKRATRGLGVHLFGLTLPSPPLRWREARGYGRWSDAAKMRQHYAYELAMGQADVNAEAVAA